MAIVKGTLSATGVTPEVSAGEVAIDITMSAGTVAIQWCVDGANWRTIEEVTESTQKVYEAPNVPIRLNCTSYSSEISYALRSR